MADKKNDKLSLMKEARKINDSLSRMKQNPEEKDKISANAVIAYQEAATAAVRLKVKSQIKAAVITYKTGVKVVKVAIYLTKATIKKLEKIKKSRETIAIINAARNEKLPEPSGVIVTNLSHEKIERIKTARKTYVKMSTAAYAGQNRKRSEELRKKRQERNRKLRNARKTNSRIKSEQTRMKNQHTFFERETHTTGKKESFASVLERVKKEKGNLIWAVDYDIAPIEKKLHVNNGSTANLKISETGESVKGVSERGKKQPRIDHTPKEKKPLSKSEQIEHAEKNLKVSEIGKQGLKKKDRKKNKNEKRKSLAAQEAKKFIVKQILGEDGDDSCKSGVGELAANILKGKAQEILRAVVKNVGKLAFKALKWILIGMAKLILTVLKWMVLLIISMISTIGIPIVLIVTVVCIAVCSIVGIGSSIVGSGEFAAKQIKEYTAEVILEGGNYYQIEFHPNTCSSGGNVYDDMLLAYLSQIVSYEDFAEDSEDAGDAPFLWINKNKEKQYISDVTKSMISTSTHIIKVHDAGVRWTKIEIKDKDGKPVKDKDGKPITTMGWEKYDNGWVDKSVFDVYLTSAGEYMRTKDASVQENYEMIRDLFIEMGYNPLGGSSICDSYGVEY